MLKFLTAASKIPWGYKRPVPWPFTGAVKFRLTYIFMKNLTGLLIRQKIIGNFEFETYQAIKHQTSLSTLRKRFIIVHYISVF